MSLLTANKLELTK